jgi:hypothetical protein
MTKDTVKRMAAATVFALAFATTPAHADCAIAGYAVKMNQFSGLSQLFMTNGFFQGADSLYFCNNFDPALDAAIAAAASSKSFVVVIGDGPSCPTSGPVRFMGNCLAVVINP